MSSAAEQSRSTRDGAEGSVPIMQDGQAASQTTAERNRARGLYDEAAMTDARLEGLARGRATRDATQAAIREARERGELSRYQLFLRGELKVSDMDDDELSRGVFKNLGGTFMSTAKQTFTAKTHADMKRELLKRGQRSLDKMYLKALEVLADIAQSSVAEDKDRLKAVVLIMERVAGKVPDKIEVGAADSFADALQGIIDDSVRDDVVPGEIVEASGS